MDNESLSDLTEALKLVQIKEYQAARTILIRILKSNPNNDKAWYLLSYTLEDQDQKIYALNRAFYLNPDLEDEGLPLAEWGRDSSKPAISIEPSVPDTDLQISKAQDHLDKGEIKAAQLLLRSILKSNPELIQGWYLLSFCEPAQRGKINALRQALRIDPDFGQGRERLQELQEEPEKRVEILKAPVKTARRISPPLEAPEPPKTPGSFVAMAKYIIRRILVIGLTIVVGVYITILIANKTGQVDVGVQSQIDRQLQWMRYNGYFRSLSREEVDSAVDTLRQEMTEEYGLNLPPVLRNLRWTWNALRFQWGTVLYRIVGAIGTTQDLYGVNKIVLTHLPNTLLVIGAADFIIFIFGIPLALYLATRRQGHWFDRFITMLSPISSIPSWVHGVLLVMIFAIQLKLLPYGGKYDTMPSETLIGNILIITKHMILPVMAVVLGLFFQLVYTWRTYFIIHSDEDYVELAKAKGLSPASIERRYVLRPTMPYILTSFAMTLVGFWQMTTALEYFFNWPGIGLLYVLSLPNFWGETWFPGEMSIVISIVVMFAYLLGIIVLLLDLVYAWIDPRIRIGANGNSVLSSSKRIQWKPNMKKLLLGVTVRKRRVTPKSPSELSLAQQIKITWMNLRMVIRNFSRSLKAIFLQVMRYPSAIIGLVLISLFVAGSLYAVIALPYVKIGQSWGPENLTGKVYLPKNVPPVWVNWFRKDDYPTSTVQSSKDGTMDKTIQTNQDGLKEISFTTTFEYRWEDFPQDVLLYIEPTYQEKYPHISIYWTTPDGRTIKPRSPSANAQLTYFFSDYLPARLYTREYPQWDEWFVESGQNATPPFYVLFADPNADRPAALNGTYQIEITALAFEENTDVEIEFVLLGRAHGFAGTDYLRRELIVPLLWGLPFALGFGLIGSIITTIAAMIIAAAGVWFGGWFEKVTQQLIEVNMILPILAIGILVYAIYNISLWTILITVIFLGVFGGPTKAFRAAFLQIREAPYIEAARAYGATNSRIIFHYLIPRVIPVMVPQLVILIPSLVFLEATLGILNVQDPRFPTWGRVIYEALTQNALWGGSEYWVLEPLMLLLLTGLAFSLLGFALERVLNPRLQSK